MLSVRAPDTSITNTEMSKQLEFILNTKRNKETIEVHSFHSFDVLRLSYYTVMQMMKLCCQNCKQRTSRGLKINSSSPVQVSFDPIDHSKPILSHQQSAFCFESAP